MRSTVFPLNSFSYRGSGGIRKYGPWAEVGKSPAFRGQLLCAGAVLHACDLRHSAALLLGRATFTNKKNGFSTKFLPRLSQGLGDTDGPRGGF